MSRAMVQLPKQCFSLNHRSNASEWHLLKMGLSRPLQQPVGTISGSLENWTPKDSKKPRTKRGYVFD